MRRGGERFAVAARIAERIFSVDNFVTEDEFVRFDRWLPIFVNGRRATNVRLSALERFREADATSVAYSQLDANNDGVLDQRELVAGGF